MLTILRHLDIKNKEIRRAHFNKAIVELHANESWRNSWVLDEFCRDNLGYNCLNIYQTFFPVKSYLKLTITMACEAHQDEPKA